MFTRKPLPPRANIDPNITSPTTPYTADNPPVFQDRSPRRELKTVAESELDTRDAWRSSDGEEGTVPDALRVGNGKRSKESSPGRSEELPESLRAGPWGFTPRSSGEMEVSTAESTNPYIRRQQTGQSESSASVWGSSAERPPQPSVAPPPPPSTGSSPPSNAPPPVPKDTPPREKFADLSISESNTNPWQPSLDTKPLPQRPGLPSSRSQDSGNEVWSSNTAHLLEQKPSTTSPPVLITMAADESPAWEEDERPSPANITPSSDLEVIQPEPEKDIPWAESKQQRERQHGAEESGQAAQQDYLRREGGWEFELPEQESVVVEDAPRLPARTVADENPPPLPPRQSQETDGPPAPLTEHQENTSATSAGATARRQKKETYEIKKVSWYDASATSNPRISPILVQNANGPCPLLALVNALTLTTPADVTTALVETLRSREQVSLGLLLDAVFDELMSGRRGDAAQELPDVSDLYAFLITLHTGMNVNPRFFPPSSTHSVNDPRNSMSHVHPMEREEAIPGTFEETREMKLYSTFSIPLIHGWLPAKGSPTYAALARSAKTYEDAQNLMFREEELEEKLEREGLSFEEQSTLEDIFTIKAFFIESATQLTPYGLETVVKAIAPGSVAILFRNDHFSTLYKHPDSHQLLHLVTDMGYAGHEEVVWESLADVNGENCEFFSGDFQIVGNAVAESRPGVDNSEWTTVAQRGNQRQGGSQVMAPLAIPGPHSSAATPLSPNTEQEDHDLALAIQLQDEEEQKHQAEIARRRREAALSEQYIEQQGSQQPNIIPVTSRGGRGGQGVRGGQSSRGGGQGGQGGQGGRGGQASQAGRGSRGSGDLANNPRNQPRGRGASRGEIELRPAIPPRRSNTNPPAPLNSADPEAGVDLPPPSYEEAATEEAYIPPADHPAHPSASAEGLTGRTSAYSSTSTSLNNAPALYSGSVLSSQTQRRASSGLGPPTRGGRVDSFGRGGVVNNANNQRTRVGQGLTHQQQVDREKDCIVM